MESAVHFCYNHVPAVRRYLSVTSRCVNVPPLSCFHCSSSLSRRLDSFGYLAPIHPGNDLLTRSAAGLTSPYSKSDFFLAYHLETFRRVLTGS